MALVHMILQGKNGVGKSFAAVLLAQYYKGRNIETVCFDTDPVYSVFASYRALGALGSLAQNGANPRVRPAHSCAPTALVRSEPPTTEKNRQAVLLGKNRRRFPGSLRIGRRGANVEWH